MKISLCKYQHILLSVLATVVIIIAISGCAKTDRDVQDICTNGIMDAGEAGVDCGGSCNVCTARDWRIKTKTSYYGNTLTAEEAFYYDNKGRLDSVCLKNQNGYIEKTEKYIYDGDSVIIAYSQQGYFSTVVYKLNSQGYAASSYQKEEGPTGRFSMTFKYDSNWHLISSNNQSSRYIWIDDNLVYTSERYETEYTYLSDKTSTIGNDNYGKGFLGVSSKNVVDTSTEVHTVKKGYSYLYDAEDRVAKVFYSAYTDAYAYY